MISCCLIEDNERVVDIVKKNLESEFAARVFTYPSFDKFKADGVAKHSRLFICRNKIEDENTAIDVLNFVYDQGLNSKVVVLGEIETSFEYVTMPDRFRLSELNRKIISALNISREELEEIKLPDFIPIPINHFYLMHHVPCPVYIRIKGDHYVKRLHESDTFDKEAIKKYEENKLEYFYVQKNHRSLFMTSLVQQSVNAVADHAGDASIAVERLGDAFTTVTDLIRSSGINDTTIPFIKGTMNTMNELGQVGERFSSLFTALINSNTRLLFRHSFMIMVFGHKFLMLENASNPEILRQLEESFMFLAFFHDIFLNDKLMAIDCRQDIIDLSLSKEDEECVLSHANMAATMVQKFPHAPQGVDVLIRQHHGSPSGYGIPDSPSSSISRLAIIFIVIEKFVWRLINFNKEKESIVSIFNDLENSFTGATYKGVVATLKNVIIATSSM